jgi:hypothetical protein
MVSIPWHRRGHVEHQCELPGQPIFNGSVTLVGGKWSFLFFDGTLRRGKVTGGEVKWPRDQNTDIGCGDGVAVVDADLSVTGDGYI